MWSDASQVRELFSEATLIPTDKKKSRKATNLMEGEGLPVFGVHDQFCTRVCRKDCIQLPLQPVWRVAGQGSIACVL